jgi:hypothetical protein
MLNVRVTEHRCAPVLADTQAAPGAYLPEVTSSITNEYFFLCTDARNSVTGFARRFIQPKTIAAKLSGICAPRIIPVRAAAGKR